MKLPWKKDADDDAAQVQQVDSDARTRPDDDDLTTTVKGSAYTEGKGRPTPKRREAQNKKRGPVAPPPTNRSEARARKKELKSSMTKEDKKAATAERRAARMESRERMMAGDDKYLAPRDKGPIRAFARDIVDSRRNIAGLFLPFAIAIIFLMFIPQISQFPWLLNVLFLAFIIVLAIDGYLLGRLVNKRVRERFPDTEDGGFKLGWYAFFRATQLRKSRAPRPRVNAGDKV